jgi:MerR family transcriptional regulator, copper efflux regulator
MTIGELAKKSTVNAKLIRHYESIGLISKFIKRGHNLGFNMKDIKKLLSLWKNKSRSSKDVKALALVHLKDLEAKIAELKEMADVLKHLSKNCHGDQRPDCPILESLDSY